MIVYLDMDGVISNFCEAFEKINNVDDWRKIQDKDLALYQLRNTNFFNTIKPFKNAKKLVDFVKKIAGSDYGICSSPLTNDLYNSSYWKRVWLERYDFLPIIKNLVFTRNKEKYATERIDCSSNILVDDKIHNIKKWENAGGIGIYYSAEKDNVNDIINKIKTKYKDVR